MSLIETFRYHSQVLAAKSSALEIVHHAGDRGMEREDLVQEFLSPLLAEQFGIGRGEIRASNGEWSKQEDLIIYDRISCPRLFVGSRTQIFPVESIAAVIEVKTRLGTKEIKDASANISQARRLQKSGMATHVGAGAITMGAPTPILGVLFAFDLELTPETFRARWDEAQSALAPEQRINLVCILGKMFLIHIDHTFHLWDNTNPQLINSFYAVDSQQDSLLAFTLLLMRVLGEFRFGSPDLFKYVFSGGEKLEFKNVYGDV